MLIADTAPPPAAVEAICTIDGRAGASPQAACIVVAASRGDVAGLGFLLTSSDVRIQFVGVMDTDGSLVVTHVSFGSGRLIEVAEGSCDVVGSTITCWTPGMTVKAVVQ